MNDCQSNRCKQAVLLPDESVCWQIMIEKVFSIIKLIMLDLRYTLVGAEVDQQGKSQIKRMKVLKKKKLSPLLTSLRHKLIF